MRILSRAATVLSLVLACLVVAAGAATAAPNGNPHFIKNATGAALSGSSLVVHFKEAGLPSGSVETVVVSATTTTTYACVNNGGHNPTAANKRTFRTTESESGQFTADRNGQIVGSLTLTPPTAAELGFSCPNGQTVTLISVSYSNVTVTDITSGATIALRGTYTYTNPNAPRLR